MPFDRLSVLVVEDEDFTAEVIEALLYGIGFEHVDRAADGLDAWTMMRQRRYALVICDYRMASMSGLMFLQSVREDPEHPAADRRQRSRDPQRGGAARGRCLPAQAVHAEGLRALLEA